MIELKHEADVQIWCDYQEETKQTSDHFFLRLRFSNFCTFAVNIVNCGYGFGYGSDGCGDGDGFGNGNGYGDGYGYGAWGDGYGYGFGDGNRRNGDGRTL